MITEYKNIHAEAVLGWFDNEREFRLWAVERFKNYPVLPGDLNLYYKNENVEAYSFFYENELSGHFTMKFLNSETVRFALIAVDKKIRGRGIGQKMLSEAFDMAFELGAKKVSICVFDENAGAVNCYKKLGMQYTGRYEECSLGKYREMEKVL